MPNASNPIANLTKEDILNLIYDEPYRLGHWVGFTDLTELHNEWLKIFLFSEDTVVLQSHRGSYKTTCISLFMAIHMIIQPNENIIYFRKTDTNVQEISRQVQNILQTGVFKTIVKVLYGKNLKLTKATGNAVSTNLNTSIKGADQLVGLGIGSSVTGLHCDLCLTDDIVTKEDRISKSERMKTINNYRELFNILNRKEGSRFIHCGTPWHSEDCFAEMRKTFGEPLVYDCYSTGLMSEEMIEAKKRELPPSLFSANYEMKLVSSEDAIFKDVNWLPEDEDGSELIKNGQAHVDASYGGSDYTAYTIMHQLPDGRIIAFGKCWKQHVDLCIPEMQHWHKKYMAGTIHCETNGDKSYLARELEDQYGFFVSTYAERCNKFIKIASYLRKYWADIYWLPNTDSEYIEQILDYTENTSGHDDCPDSASSLVREMIDTVVVNTSDILRGGII